MTVYYWDDYVYIRIIGEARKPVPDGVGDENRHYYIKAHRSCVSERTIYHALSPSLVSAEVIIPDLTR